MDALLKALVIFFLVTVSGFVSAKPPVVIVPGDGGSRLMAKLDKPSVPHHWCEKKSSGWFDLWLNLKELLPFVRECFSDNMRLIYNSTSKEMVPPPGVKVRVPYFGNTTGIKYLDPSLYHPGEYFAEMVDALVAIGYEEGVSLRGAPYDFRKAPNSADEYFANLKNLIEETYEKNSKEAIMLLSHSLGCPFTLHFLNKQTQEWKDKYIKVWVTIAGAWGGAAKLWRLLASGTNLGFPDIVLEPLSLRPSLRTYESSAFLIPSSDFWKPDEVFVKTAKKTYSLSNIEEFFHDIKFPEGLLIRSLVPPIWTGVAPNIPMYCLYGYGIPTPELFTYAEGEFPDTYPFTTRGDGDGTVNTRSLEGCKRFKELQSKEVVTQKFKNGEHMAILDNSDVIDLVKKILTS